MVDTRDLKSLAEKRAGSSPAEGTNNKYSCSSVVRAARS